MKRKTYKRILVAFETCIVLVFFAAIKSIFPGIPTYFIFPVMFLTAVPADFLATWYTNSRDRGIFLRRLNMAMIFSGFTIIMITSITLVVIIKSVGAEPVGNICLRSLRAWCSMATFISIVAAENLFAGRLLVEMVNQTKPDIVMKSWFWKE